MTVGVIFASQIIFSVKNLFNGKLLQFILLNKQSAKRNKCNLEKFFTAKNNLTFLSQNVKNRFLKLKLWIHLSSLYTYQKINIK